MQTKKWYESKTLWLSIATSIVGILMAISESVQETGGNNGVLVTVIGILNGILRYVTSQPIE
jgi:hypothetical protein